MTKKGYKLDDTVIATIAKTLQVALLTGTDIVDNLRQIEIQNNGDGTFGITPNYNSQFEHWMAKMLEELEAKQAEHNNQPEEVKSLFD